MRWLELDVPWVHWGPGCTLSIIETAYRVTKEMGDELGSPR